MPDDWSTVSLGRDKALEREIQILRERYLEHSDQLEKLLATAPSENLAKEYQRLRDDITATITKLDELERGVGPVPRRAATMTPIVNRPDTERAATAPPGSLPAWSPGNSELRAAPSSYNTPATPAVSTGARLLLIGVAGVAVLFLLGFLMWKYLLGLPRGVDELPIGTAAEDTTTMEPDTPVETTPPAPPVLQAEPSSYDFGLVQKGTRKTNRFRLTNNGDSQLTINVARSECRCLWFDYPATIPAGGSISLTVTVDGARAERGSLREVARIASKSDPSAGATIEVSATIE
ncbi:MAG TPA: DUF1573 domain-containing protein [Thermoanaerobaculia bacterium]|nr:DUF1573 domain-containing protein [Thermoanaerobaculia bacterium]